MPATTIKAKQCVYLYQPARDWAHGMSLSCLPFSIDTYAMAVVEGFRPRASRLRLQS